MRDRRIGRYGQHGNKCGAVRKYSPDLVAQVWYIYDTIRILGYESKRGGNWYERTGRLVGYGAQTVMYVVTTYPRPNYGRSVAKEA